MNAIKDLIEFLISSPVRFFGFIVILLVVSFCIRSILLAAWGKTE